MKDVLTRYARSAYAVFKQLKLKGLITALSSGSEFSQLIKPLGARPLILSGHPGDEVMAMGGTMAWYGKLGHPVAVLTFTAGRRGTNTGRLSKSLGPKRRKEQMAAFKVLPAEINPVYWDLDERFAVTEDLIYQLLEAVDEINPDIIYVPSLLDIHPDSQAINRVLVAVIERLPSPRLKTLQVAQYELWTPIVPNKILSLDGYEEAKQTAIECHESQLLCRNYLDAMLGLNRYRAAMLGAGNYAEAFFICSAKQYLEFLNVRPAPVIEMVP